MQKHFNRLAVVVAIAGLVLASWNLPIHAASVTWTGATDNNWDTTTSNWTSPGTYTEGDDVTFNSAGGTINLSSNHAPTSTTVNTAASTYTFTGGSITSGSLSVLGGGTLVLNSAYTTPSGVVSIANNSTLRLGASNLLSDSITLQSAPASSGTLDMNGFDDTVGVLYGYSGVVNIINMGTLTVKNGYDRTAGIMSGSGKLIVDTALPLYLNAGGITYTGGTQVMSGTLHLYGANNVLSTIGDMQVDAAGVWDLNVHNSTTTQTIDQLSGTGTINSSNNLLGNTTLIIGNNNGSSTWSGNYQGAGLVQKVGSGTIAFTGNNLYTGTTLVSGGKLVINGTQGTLMAGQDNYTVQSGATLGGSGTINLAATKAVTILSGGILEPGNSAGTMTINGGLNLNDGAILNFELGVGGDTVVVNGLLTGSASAGGITLNLTQLSEFGSFVLLDWTNGSAVSLDLSDFNVVGGNIGTLSIVGSQLLFTIPVPEPASFTLLGLGLLALVRKGRRQRNAALATA